MKYTTEMIFNMVEILDLDVKIAMWNDVCDAINTPDDRVYYADEFDSIMDGYLPSEVHRMEYFGYDRLTLDDDDVNKRGQFNIVNSEYFYFNAYGNLISMTKWIADDIINKWFSWAITEDFIEENANIFDEYLCLTLEDFKDEE